MNLYQFWKDVLAQNAARIQTYFHPNAYINWHCTNEHFNVEEYITANCEYPGSWDGEVERLEQAGDVWITVTHVYPLDQTLSFHVTSFFKVIDDKIMAMDEYWADDGLPPEWRTQKRIGTAIR